MGVEEIPLEELVGIRDFQVKEGDAGFPLFRNHKIPGFFQDFSRNLTPFSRYIFALPANLQLQF